MLKKGKAVIQQAIDDVAEARDRLQAKLDEEHGDVGDAGAAIEFAVKAINELLEQLAAFE